MQKIIQDKISKNNIDNNMYKEENNNNFLCLDNSLIHYLFNNLFCKYCKITQLDIENKIKKNKNDSETNIKFRLLNEKNELFQLLCNVSLFSKIIKISKNLNYKTYINSLLYKTFMKYITKSAKAGNKIPPLTQNILLELINTENISDFGLESNFYFNYITNVCLNSKFNKINSIQSSIVCDVEEEKKTNNKQICLIESDDSDKNDEQNINQDDVIIIWKKKDTLIEEIENNFVNDNDLKLENLRKAFNYFLVNVYYKYIKFILTDNNHNNK